MTDQTLSPAAMICAAIEACGRKDYEAGFANVADDCEYTNIPMGTVRGPAAMRAQLEPFFAGTISNEFVFSRVIEAGDGIVFMERVDRHQLGPHRWAELPIAGVFEVRGGKITVWRDYFDLETLFRQWPEIRAAG